MKILEIIVHCYAEQIPDFASMLTAQLSSIIRHPPSGEGRVVVWVCTAISDRLTHEVVAAMGYRASLLPDNRVRFESFTSDKRFLFRRAIGRNVRARRTHSDVVWFADADYIMSAGSIDAILAIDFTTLPLPLAYPKQVFIQRSHASGDKAIATIIPGEDWILDTSAFDVKTEKFAIGGLQIVSGETARQHGYLDNTKWVRPVDPTLGFQDTKEDKAYRAALGGSCGVEIPGLYRMRHSRSAFETAEKRLAQTAGK